MHHVNCVTQKCGKLRRETGENTAEGFSNQECGRQQNPLSLSSQHRAPKNSTFSWGAIFSSNYQRIMTLAVPIRVENPDLPGFTF
jgi:hypothetical protein